MTPVKKVELSDYMGTPVYFHTSADIVSFNKKYYSETTGPDGNITRIGSPFAAGLSKWLKMEDAGGGKSVESAILALNARINYMIQLNEDLKAEVIKVQAETARVKETLGASTLMLTQASFIKADYFEATGKDEPPYTATLQVPAVRATDTVIISPVQHADINRAQAQLESYNCISNLIIGDGVITLKCYDMKPTTGIPVQIVIFRTKGKDEKGSD